MEGKLVRLRDRQVESGLEAFRGSRWWAELRVSVGVLPRVKGRIGTTCAVHMARHCWLLLPLLLLLLLPLLLLMLRRGGRLVLLLRLRIEWLQQWRV
mgnify:CR=1 FL=1|jgi:hypothetical protein